MMRPVYKAMLLDPVDYYSKDNLDFYSAKRIADARAKEKVKKPMLLALYCKKSTTPFSWCSLWMC
jgi:hypothetical protein